MKPSRWIIGILLLAGSAYAATNLVITLIFSDEQYANIENTATNQGLTVQQYLRQTNAGIAQVIGDEANRARLRLLLERWQAANETKRQAALNALQ